MPPGDDDKLKKGDWVSLTFAPVYDINVKRIQAKILDLKTDKKPYWVFEVYPENVTLVVDREVLMWKTVDPNL